MAVVELDPQAMIRAGNSITSNVVPGYQDAAEGAAHGVPAGLRSDLRMRIFKMQFRSFFMSARVSAFGANLKMRGMLLVIADSVGGFGGGVPPVIPLPGGRIPVQPPRPWGITPRIPKNWGNITPSRTPPNPSVPPGASPRSVAALQWAEAQNGKWKAPDADAARYSAADWGKGGVGEWSYDCVKFVDSAWFNATGRSADLLRNGNAADIFNSYNADGLVKQGTPPAGAAVFWPDIAGGYGHIAIADGNGGVWTTTGQSDGAHGAVTHLNADQIHYKGRTGWVLPG